MKVPGVGATCSQIHGERTWSQLGNQSQLNSQVLLRQDPVDTKGHMMF